MKEYQNNDQIFLCFHFGYLVSPGFIIFEAVKTNPVLTVQLTRKWPFSEIQEIKPQVSMYFSRKGSICFNCIEKIWIFQFHFYIADKNSTEQTFVIFMYITTHRGNKDMIWNCSTKCSKQSLVFVLKSLNNFVFLTDWQFVFTKVRGGGARHHTPHAQFLYRRDKTR